MREGANPFRIIPHPSSLIRSLAGRSSAEGEGNRPPVVVRNRARRLRPADLGTPRSRECRPKTGIGWTARVNKPLHGSTAGTYGGHPHLTISVGSFNVPEMVTDYSSRVNRLAGKNGSATVPAAAPAVSPANGYRSNPRRRMDMQPV